MSWTPAGRHCVCLIRHLQNSDYLPVHEKNQHGTILNISSRSKNSKTIATEEGNRIHDWRFRVPRWWERAFCTSHLRACLPRRRLPVSLPPPPPPRSPGIPRRRYRAREPPPPIAWVEGDNLDRRDWDTPFNAVRV